LRVRSCSSRFGKARGGADRWRRCAPSARTSSERDGDIPKYLLKASYSPEGARGVAGAGGSSRRDAIEALARSAGGSLEGFYFAFGEADVYVIADLPDDTAAAAISLTVNSQGAAQVKTVRLIEPEVMDEAAKRSVEYRPPGS